jgi:hypothetical protein
MDTLLMLLTAAAHKEALRVLDVLQAQTTYVPLGVLVKSMPSTLVD